MVDHKIMGGKAEKSKGSALLSPTMIINSASNMLKVKKISNIMGGIGSTSIASTMSTTVGMAKEDQEIFPEKCRRSDIVNDATAITALKIPIICGVSVKTRSFQG